MNRKVYVESEFAALKRVVLTQSEFIFPSQTEVKMPYDESFLPEEAIKKHKTAGGRSFAEAFPEDQKLWEKEREDLKQILEKYGVEVLRPRLMTNYEKEISIKPGGGNFFVRDPFFTLGNMLIEGSLRFFHRRNEVLPVRDLLIKEARDEEVIYFSCPRPNISEGLESKRGPFIEGGDVLIYGKKVFVGHSGLASNKVGHQWLQSALRPFGYEVISVELSKDILHLDCAMSLMKEGFMIVCEEALVNGIPKALKGWEKITVTKDEAKHLKVNGLAIDESNYITDMEFQDLGEKLEEKGIHVEYVDFKISRSLGGSIRCSTQPLLRMNP